jgi:hypothetical protein
MDTSFSQLHMMLVVRQRVFSYFINHPSQLLKVTLPLFIFYFWSFPVGIFYGELKLKHFFIFFIFFLFFFIDNANCLVHQ